MASLSSIFWVLGFALSIVLAPQLRIWTWGRAMLCFAVAGLAALPIFWKDLFRGTAGGYTIVPCFLLAVWITIRAFTSPVVELAQSDLLLTAMAVVTFLSFHASAKNARSQKIIIYGIGLILLVSILVIANQVADPMFTPVFPNETPRAPAGFFAHYSYGASFLIPTSLLAAAAALHSKENWLARLSFGLLALAAMYAVFLTKSRGGVIGMAGGFALLVFLSILAGKQRNKKWFAPAMISLPFILVAVGVFFLRGLMDVQEIRGGGDAEKLLDNAIRFYMAGIAISCIALHPFLGGGSRSYSWECFRFWDTSAMGFGGAKPEHTHNELLQTVSEYGLLGGVLVVITLILASVLVLVRITSTNKKQISWSNDNFWRIGGLAGLAGLFLQSNFEGIFRLPPGAVLLALCLSACMIPVRSNAATDSKKSTRTALAAGLMCPICAVFMILLVIFGYKGTVVTPKIWNTYFSLPPLGLETQADHLTEAIAVWPLYSLYEKRAWAYRALGSKPDLVEPRQPFLELSLSDFKSAGILHPYNPEFAINAAILAGTLGREKEAEELFRKGISLQGEMEAAFSGHRFFFLYLYEKGVREYEAGNLVEALVNFKLAVSHTEKIAIYGINRSSRGREYFRARVRAYEYLAKCYAELGEYEQAAETYDTASKLRDGNTSNYLLSVFYGKLAVEAWSERRGSDALKLFNDARHRMIFAREFPEGITPEKRLEWIKYFDQSISYLKAARFEPSEKITF